MISTFIIQSLYTAVSFILSVVPTGPTLPQSWVNAVNLIWGYINVFSFIAPAGTLATVLALAFVFHGTVFSVRLISWVLRKIPFVN